MSEVALGGWLTHGRSIDDQTTDSIVKRAFELGINFFDTADVYNLGEAEKSLAKAIKGIRREDLFIATKCFFPMSEAPNDRGLSRKHIVESVNNSLKRLQLEAIDLYQFHRFDPETPLEEMIRAVDDLIRQGKIHYWGVSMWPAHSLVDACHVSRNWNCCLPVSNQPVYNMLVPDIDKTVIPVSEQHGIGQVVFSPLAQGILTGKYRPGTPMPVGSRGADDKSNMFMGDHLKDEVLAKVAKLKAFAESKGITLSQFSLAWCLRKSNVSSVIIGATSIEQLEENIKASGVEFSDEVWEEAAGFLA